MVQSPCRRVAELSIFDRIDTGGHPAAADQRLVNLRLLLAGPLHGRLVEPNIRDVETISQASCPSASRLPGDSQIHNLAIERLLSACGPQTFGNQIFHCQTFAAAPDSGGGVDGHLLFAFLVFRLFQRSAIGDDRPFPARPGGPDQPLSGFRLFQKPRIAPESFRHLQSRREQPEEQAAEDIQDILYIKEVRTEWQLILCKGFYLVMNLLEE